MLNALMVCVFVWKGLWMKAAVDLAVEVLPQLTALVNDPMQNTEVMRFMLNYNYFYENLYTDIDECSEDIHFCNNNNYCVNTIGSYRCQCNDGYRGNGTFCSKLQYNMQDVSKCV